MSEEGYVTAVDVKNHALCPKITYFVHVLHLKERVTEAMEYGREVHEQAPLELITSRLKPVKVLRNLELVDRQLRLKGKVDTLVVTAAGEYVPFEVKWSDPDPSGGAQPHHKAQMAAYAMLVDRAFNTTVKRAIIYYARAGKLVQVPITHQLKKHVKEMVEQIAQLVKSEEEPLVKQSPSKCVNCGYQAVCQAMPRPPRHIKLKQEPRVV